MMSPANNKYIQTQQDYLLGHLLKGIIVLSWLMDRPEQERLIPWKE